MNSLLLYLFVILPMGLAFGSFVTALSYRLPKSISIWEGRSFCDNCKTKLKWYDNIPLLSYLLLRGKCRNCKKKISVRYPLIEFITLSVFSLIYFVFLNCDIAFLTASPICIIKNEMGLWGLPYLLTVAVIMLAIFVIDWEEQIIPDFLVFFLLLLVVTSSILTNQIIWSQFFSGFAVASFLLMLHIVTFGKGMGLGDAKLAIPVAFLLGLKLAIAWLFLSFVIGAVVGIFLIIFGKAKFGVQIAFGPFLVISFFIILIFGNYLLNFLFIV